MPPALGSVLLAYSGRGDAEGKPFITLTGLSSAVSGLIIFYPEWKQSDMPPVPYPPCISGEAGENFSITNCCLVNPYEGIRLTGMPSGRHFISGVYGYPINRGIYIDGCKDVGRIENCHFWPFAVHFRIDDPYCTWINQNGVAFEFGSSDWQMMTNCFAFGYGVGFKFSQGRDNHVCNGTFTNIGSDCSGTSVLVERAAQAGLLFTNGNFVGRWSSRDSLGIDIGPECDGRVVMTNCSFWGPTDVSVRQRSSKGTTVLNSCLFERWDVGSRGHAAVECEAGSITVSSCDFSGQGLSVRVGEKADSALLIGNQALRSFRVDNRAGERTVTLANKTRSIKWKEKGKLRYRLSMGVVGDESYLLGWNSGGPAPAHGEFPGFKAMRWSGAASRLVLPVVAGKAYRMKVYAHVPEHSVSDENGIYLDGQRIVALRGAGAQIAEGIIPAGKSKEVTLEVRSGTWVPMEKIGNLDVRTLGIDFRAVEMIAVGSSGRFFNANDGTWSDD